MGVVPLPWLRLLVSGVWFALLGLLILKIPTNVVAADEHSATFLLLARDKAVRQTPFLSTTTNISALGCSSACGQEERCAGFNYAPETRQCQLVTSAALVSAMTLINGSQVWFRQSLNTPDGAQIRVASHPDGHITHMYIAFLDSNTTLAEANATCSIVGGRVAPFTSFERLTFFGAALLDPSVSTVNAGLWDPDNDGIFKNFHEGIYEPVGDLQIIWNPPAAPHWSWADSPCLTVVFPDGAGASTWKPDYNKTMCTSKHPWICELPRGGDEQGCWMDPPIPYGAEIDNNKVKIPAETGAVIEYKCERGQRFVNGGVSPNATCLSDGYWNKLYPFSPCTGGPNYMEEEKAGTFSRASRTCYKVDMNIRVRIDNAHKHCNSLGGSLLSITNESKPVFEVLPRDPLTNEHFRYVYSGFYNYTNVTAAGNPLDIEGNRMDPTIFDRPYDVDPKSANENNLVVYYRDDVRATPWWGIRDVGTWTTHPRIICKFQGC